MRLVASSCGRPWPQPPHQRLHPRRVRVGLGCLLVLSAFALSCRDNQLGIEKRIANQPPQTQISAGPRDGTRSTPYRVSLSWWGTDPDGVVDHYEFILVDHPRGIRVSSSTPLPITFPEIDDPRWFRTQATDTLLVTVADTLLRDPEPGPDESPDDVRQEALERWHTFFVRAVDNNGAVDATPDYLSFNAKNFAPTIELLDPARPGATLVGTAAIQFLWDGEDPDGDTGRPLFTRWVLIESRISWNNRWWSWPDSLYHLPERYEWSPWKEWDAEDGSGRGAVVRGLLSVGERQNPPSGHYIFAVQAKDEGGAVTTVFDRTTLGKNNATFIRVTGPPGPRLVVEGGALGTHQFIGTGQRVRLEVAVGQPIQFRWSADASQYGGRIEAYRYGWNLLDPNEDDGWERNWASSVRSMSVHHARDVLEYFYLQTRDTAGLVTSAVFEIVGYPVTKNRDVLWVDDTHDMSPSEEIQEDERWVTVLADVASDAGFEFSPDLDVWDVDERHGPPPARVLFDYKAVVWSVRSAWGLAQVARFVDPFAGRGGNSGRFNYVNVYLENDGNLWINGDQPGRDLWPTERHKENNGYFVNVTNWDDPIAPHPLIDSAGTSSLLYELGVEMFDIGAATGSDRERKQYFCLGLERTTPDGVTAQQFETSFVVGHQHVLSIDNAILDRLGGNDVVLQTDVVEGHSHEVVLGSAAISELQSGGSVTFLTAAAADPEPHAHQVDVSDQIGRWGAPFLLTGSGWNPAPGIGRPNVEIYNMPGAITAAIPPLRPDPRRSLAVYKYRSELTVDPETGLFYPQTPDQQPVFILARKTADAPRFSRALCSFPLGALHSLSQQWLTEYVLVRHFGLGRTP